MAEVKKIKAYDVSAEKFYQAIIDYEKYPEFLDGMNRVHIIKSSATSAEVEYELNLIKKFTYTLKHKHKKNKEISWTLKSGDLFKVSEGFWKLKKLGATHTEVTYFLNVETKLFVPKMIEKKLINVQVPSTMEAYYQRAKTL